MIESDPRCLRCPYRKRLVNVPDHLAMIGAQEATIAAVRANNAELRAMMAGLVVAGFLARIGEMNHGSE